MPPYDGFVSSLQKNKNTLEIQYSKYEQELTCIKKDKDYSSYSIQEMEQEALKRLKWKKKPLTGVENYENLKNLWRNEGWKTLPDCLE